MKGIEPLTQAEKVSGRAFKAAAQTALTTLFTELKPAYNPPYFLGTILRHPCPARGGVSSGLTLKEVYHHSEVDGDIPAGRFGFYYKRGKCSACQQIGLSAEGKFVDAYLRPPNECRVGR